MRIDVLTLFPGMFAGALGESIVSRGIEAGALAVHLHNFRDHGIGRHQKVDDTPCGGGPGLVLYAGPILNALDSVELTGTTGASAEAIASAKQASEAAPARVKRVLFTPQGRPLTQEVVRELASEERLILLCGHYEGFDERIRLLREWDEISLGDFVLTGGELPAMVLIDAMARLLPGVLGDETSAHDESFEDGLLEYPQYTRPLEYEGLKVPDVLLSGHHANIAKWRLEQAKERTKQRRPDLWERYQRNESSTK